MKKSSPEFELCSPVPFHTGSNGEFVPRGKTTRDDRAEALYRRVVDDSARRRGVSRREFVHSASGTAAALLVINQVYGCGGGSGFAVDANTAVDADQACEALSGDEFIVDVQTHAVNPDGAWRDGPGAASWEFVLASFPYSQVCAEPDKVDCYDQSHYTREVFVNSDTAVAVLSALPADPGENPLTAEEAAEVRAIIEQLSGSPRALLHGFVSPDLGQGQLDGMQRLVEDNQIDAWKVYTQWGGWWLDDPEGIAFIERARELDVKTICAHKGLTLQGFDPEFASSRDLGVVAAAYPDVNFIAYHSNFEFGVTEGAYDPQTPRGVDELIKAAEDNGIARNTGNLYAELGSTWRGLMTSPTQAAHVLGKLLVHLGEDRILWGTDSIWYGSPQDQIAAFRAFEISEQMQEAFGYPALTPEIKAKILGLNAAALYGVDPEQTLCAIRDDQISARKQELVERPALQLRGYGPTTRREFFAFLRSRGGMPG